MQVRRAPSYPARSFSFLSVMPSLDTSLLNTRIPMTMFTCQAEGVGVGAGHGRGGGARGGHSALHTRAPTRSSTRSAAPLPRPAGGASRTATGIGSPAPQHRLPGLAGSPQSPGSQVGFSCHRTPPRARCSRSSPPCDPPVGPAPRGAGSPARRGWTRKGASMTQWGCRG